MSEQQAEEYEKLIHRKLEILRKPSGNQWSFQTVEHEGVRIIYAGGIYWGRDRTLTEVARTVRKLRKEGQNVTLDIYTNSPMNANRFRDLNDEEACFVHKAIPFQELVSEYSKSDIALHVESFKKKNAMFIRLSFSTKIVDCLSSGCAVMAICPGNNAGWLYLKDEEAAECVDDIRNVEQKLTHLVQDKGYREKLRINAKACVCSNHERDKIVATLMEQLDALQYAVDGE
jgi:glycosyltransferase involved in cell wall biosynthesis